MNVSFQLTGKGFSINAAYFARRKVKTEACRLWEHDIATKLYDIKDLTDLADQFKETGGTFSIRIVWEYPPHVFLNKQGVISAKTFDVDNCCKLLLDQIFMGRMGIDDRFLTKLVSEKRAGAQHCIKVSIELT